MERSAEDQRLPSPGACEGEAGQREAREPITLFVEYEGAEDLLGDYTENLSSGGAFINTHRDFEIGTLIHLVLVFPGLLQKLALTGEVRWKREGQRGVGLAFTDAEQAAHLEALLERIRRRDPDVVTRAYRVLVVEDNEHVSQLIQEGLTSSSHRSFGDRVVFHFRTADNGRDACTILRKERFDAVIMDVYLPMLDGPEVIKFVRQELANKSLPIIAVSAGGESAKASALEAGANMFIDKPMRLKQVIETMKQLLAATRVR